MQNLKPHWQISEKWRFEKHCSYDRVCQFDQKKIKRSRKEWVEWTIFKFWPMNNIFWELSASESLIMACLQVCRESLSPTTFIGVLLNSIQLSYLFWENTYPHLKTTCYVKLNLFLVNETPRKLTSWKILKYLDATLRIQWKLVFANLIWSYKLRLWKGYFIYFKFRSAFF